MHFIDARFFMPMPVSYDLSDTSFPCRRNRVTAVGFYDRRPRGDRAPVRVAALYMASHENAAEHEPERGRLAARS